MLKLSKKIVYSLVTLFFILFASNSFLLYQNHERNRIISVVDGDSIQTKDNRRIRLLALDAPEKGRCMHQEATEKLKELVLGKTVRLEDVVTDNFGRILANVFVGKTLVNKIMLEEGLARFVYVSSPYYEELKSAYLKAKESEIGIFSSECRNITPIKDCVIKGNIKDGEKIYHLPECYNYDQVIIDEAFGDEWFCTEDEAKKAGFRKVTGCRE